MALRHPRATGPRVYTEPQLGFVGYGGGHMDQEHRGRSRARGSQFADYDMEHTGHGSPALGGLQGLQMDEPLLLSPGDEDPLSPHPHGLNASAKTSILRDVDQFVMSLPLGTGQGDVEIEEAVASRLYRTELARAEAQTKLNEWVRVASELKEIVQQQQAQIQVAASQRRAHHGSANRSLSAVYSSMEGSLEEGLEGSSGSKPLPPLAHLQRLVHDMRAELRQPAPGAVSHISVAPSHQGQPAADGGRGLAELQAELDKTRRQLKQLQDSYDQMVDTQVQGKAAAQQQSASAAAELGAEVKALGVEVEHWKRVGESARGEAERIRKALIDAEIEMQRGANDMETLKQQLQSAEATAAQAQSVQQVQREELGGLRQQLQQAAQHSAVLVADNASLKQRVAELEGRAEHAQPDAARAVQLGAEVVRLIADLSERDSRLAKLKDAADVAADAAQQQRMASDALLNKLQLRVAELESALQSSTTRAAAAADVAGAESAALRTQLATAQRAQQHAEQEAQRALQQAQQVSVAAELSQRRLQAAEDEREKLQAQLQQALDSASTQSSRAPTPQLVAQKEMEIKALEEVLGRVRAAAQQKDAQIVAMQQERDAAVAAAQQTQADAAEWLSERETVTQLALHAEQAQQQARDAQEAHRHAEQVQQAQQEEWERKEQGQRAQLKSVEQDLAAAKAENRGLEAQAQLLRSQLEEAQSRLADRDRQVGVLSRQSSDAESMAQQAKRVETQVLDLLTKVEALKRGLAGKERDVAAARESKEVVDQQLRQAQLQLEEAQQQLIQRERDHQAALMRLRHPSAAAAAVAAAVATSQEMTALQEELSQAVEAAQQAQQEGEAAKARLEQQVWELEAVVQRLEGQLQERGAEAQRAKQQLQGIAEQLERQQQERNIEAQHAKEQLQGMAEQLQRQQQELAAQLEAAAAREQHAAAEVAVLREKVQHAEGARAEAEGGSVWEAQLSEARLQHDELVQHLQDQQQEVLRELEAQHEQHLAAVEIKQRQLAARLKAAERELEGAVVAHQQELQELRAEHEQALATATGGPSAEEVEQLQEAHSAELDQIKHEFSAQIDRLKFTHAAEINALRAAHRAELGALRARHESELAAQYVERGEAGTPTEGDGHARQQQRGMGMDAEIPSPLQRRFQQRLHQVEEEAAAELASVRCTLQQQAAAALLEVQAQHDKQLDAQLAEHEAQVAALRVEYEKALEDAELRHLAELEEQAQQVGEVAVATEDVAGGRSAQLAARVRALEALRVKQELEIQALSLQLQLHQAAQQQAGEGMRQAEVLQQQVQAAQQELRGAQDVAAALEQRLQEVEGGRAEAQRREQQAEEEAQGLREVLQQREDELERRLAELSAEHEAQLGVVMVKQSLMAEELEALAQAAQQSQHDASANAARAAELAAERATAQAEHAAEVDALRQRHWAELDSQRAEHTADMAALLTAAIFRGVHAAQTQAVAGAQHQSALLSASLNSAALRRAFKNSPDLHWLCSDAPLHEDPFSRPPSLLDAHNPLDTPRHSTASSPQRAPHAINCRITAAAASTPPSGAASRTGGVRRCLLQSSAEDQASPRFSSGHRLAGAAGWGASSPARMPRDVGGSAQAAQLASLLEEALAEVDRRGSALEECQDMLAELQAFSQAKKDQVTQLCTELEGQQALMRETLSRLRATEEQLLQSQAALAQTNSKADKYERNCRKYLGELEELKSGLEQRGHEAAALSGQLLAAQTSHQLALGRVEQLAGALATAEREKAQAEARLAEAQQALAGARAERGQGSAGGMEALLQELLLAQQSLREGASRPASGLGMASGTLPHQRSGSALDVHPPPNGVVQNEVAGTRPSQPKEVPAVRRRHLSDPAELPHLHRPRPQQQEQEGEGGRRAQQRHLDPGDTRITQHVSHPGSGQEGRAGQTWDEELPSHFLRPIATIAQHAAVLGSEGQQPDTPLSGASCDGSELWSDPGMAGVGPSKKKRGALHKLAKMLRGGGSASKAQRGAAQLDGTQEDEDRIPAVHRVHSRDLMPPPAPRLPKSHLGPLGYSMEQQQHLQEQDAEPDMQGAEAGSQHATHHDQASEAQLAAQHATQQSMQQPGQPDEPGGGREAQAGVAAIEEPPRRRQWRLQTLLEEEADRLRQQGQAQGQLCLLGDERREQEAMPHPSALPPALRNQPYLQQQAVAPHHLHQQQPRGEARGARAAELQRASSSAEYPRGRGTGGGTAAADYEEGRSSWERQKAQYVYNGESDAARIGHPAAQHQPQLRASWQAGKEVRLDWRHDDSAGAAVPRQNPSSRHSRPASGLSECPSPDGRQYYQSADAVVPLAQPRQPGQAGSWQQPAFVHSNALFDS